MKYHVKINRELVQFQDGRFDYETFNRVQESMVDFLTNPLSKKVLFTQKGDIEIIPIAVKKAKRYYPSMLR